MLRRATILALGLATALVPHATRAVESASENYRTVDVAPSKTSIYVGSVSMTLPRAARVNGAYETTYAARVFPYFFSNENGRLRVELSDESLQKLARGESVEFKGQAWREDGAERRIEGKATPFDARSGKIKVRVFVSRRIELIFNTTYRFPEEPAAGPTATER